MKNALVNDDTVQPKSPRNNADKTNGKCSLLNSRVKSANFKDQNSDQENESSNDKLQAQGQRKIRSFSVDKLQAQPKLRSASVAVKGSNSNKQEEK
jgi:hypothetical protein